MHIHVAHRHIHKFISEIYKKTQTKSQRNIDDFDIKAKNSTEQDMVPVSNLQTSQLQFHLCLLRNNMDPVFLLCQLAKC